MCKRVIKGGVLVVGAAVFFLFFGLGVLITQHSEAAPVITVTEDVYDFGEVKQGDELEHTFVISNSGDETLVIEKVTSS